MDRGLEGALPGPAVVAGALEQVNDSPGATLTGVCGGSLMVMRSVLMVEVLMLVSVM